MKLHVLGYRRKGIMPYPEQIVFTPSTLNNLSLFKKQWSEIANRVLIGDKVYIDKDFLGEWKG